MLSKNTVKFINSLKIKKYRHEHQAFLIEGEKSVEELLASSFPIMMVLGTADWHSRYESILRNHPGLFKEVTFDELKKVSDLSTPNQVLAVAGIPPDNEAAKNSIDGFILAIDGIRDPGNLGTILRTADWFGFREILCSTDCVDLYNPKVIQASMGSFLRVNVVYTNLEKKLQQLSGKTPIYGALLEGEIIINKKFKKNGILIIGNESRGISEELLPFITDPVFIPGIHSVHTEPYHAESLNASMANAIITYEIYKQLYKNKF